MNLYLTLVVCLLVHWSVPGVWANERPYVIVIIAADLGAEGMGYGRGYFVHESRFRLNEEGKLYDIPVTSDKERYSNKVTIDPAHEADRHRLQAALDQFMAIESEIAPKRKGGTRSKISKEKQP